MDLKYIFCISCFILALSTTAEHTKLPSNDRGPSTFGTEFVFVFPLFAYSIDQVNETALDLYVLITNQYNQLNNINISMPNGTVDSYQLRQNESKQITFKDPSLLVYDTNTRIVFFVNSEYSVSVHAGIKCNNVGDSFLVLPTNVLGTHYFITTAGTSSYALNQILVISLKDQPALVNLPTCSGTAVQSITLPFPAAYVITCSNDLSGLVITSNVSVAVMSGLVSFNNGDKFGAEMLIPDKYWGTGFRLTNLTNSGYSCVFKILASRNETYLFSDAEYNFKRLLNQGEWTIFNQQSGVHNYIFSVSPISIFLIPGSNADADNMSLYIQLVPTDDFNALTHLQHVEISIPSLNNVENYVTVQQNGGNELTIDGILLQTPNDLFSEVYSWYYHDTFCGGVTSLQFNNTLSSSSMDLSSTSTLSIPSSMVQYGISQASLVYGHVTAVTFPQLLPPDDVHFDSLCEFHPTRTIFSRRTLTSTFTPHYSQSTRDSLTTKTSNSPTPTLRTNSVSHISTPISTTNISSTSSAGSFISTTSTSPKFSTPTIVQSTVSTLKTATISQYTTTPKLITTTATPTMITTEISHSPKSSISSNTMTIYSTPMLQTTKLSVSTAPAFNTLFHSTTTTLSTTTMSNSTTPTLRSSTDHRTSSILRNLTINISNSTSPTPLMTTTNSQISTIIDELANTTISNVTDVTNALTILNDTLIQVTQTGYPLTSNDLKNIANILCNCSVIPGLLDQDFYLYMDSYNEVLNTNIQTIREAQAFYNSSLYYQACLQYMVRNTVNSSLVYNNNNVAAGNLDTDCSQIDSSDTSSVAFVQYSNSSVELISNLTKQWFNSDNVVAFAILPTISLCDSAWSQIGIVRNDFVLYQGQQFFGSASINSSVSDGCTVQRTNQTNCVVTVKILTNITKASVQLSQPLSYGFRVKETDKQLHSTTVCGYWDLNWFTNGCYLTGVQGDFYICQCTHLTDFSLLVDSSATDPALCDQTLQILGIVVAALSVASLFASLVLKVIQKGKFVALSDFFELHFQKSRKKKSVVHDTLMVALFIFYILFAILSDSRVTNMSAMGCNISAAVLFTVLFATMFFAAFGCLTFFKVYYIVFRHDILNMLTSKLFVIGTSLGIPISITFILWFSFNPFFVRNDGFCWINPLFVVYAIVVPTSILVIADIAITGMLIKSFYCAGTHLIQSAKSRKKIMINKVMVLVTVQFIIACPWIFEYFTIGTPEVTVFHYLFTLTNGSQGIWLSMIYMYSFFKLIRKAKKVNNTGTINDQLCNNAGTKLEVQMSQLILTIKNTTSDAGEKSRHVAAMNDSKATVMGLVPLSISRKTEKGLSPDKNSTVMSTSNGMDKKYIIVQDTNKKASKDKNKVATTNLLNGTQKPRRVGKTESYYDRLHGTRPFAGGSPTS